MILGGGAIAEQGAGTADGDDLRAVLLAFVPDAEIPPMTHADPDAEPLRAEVNHGTWIAVCPCGAEGLPAPGCVVWTGQPWAWCVRCGNAAAGGRWRPVVLPSEHAVIETVLMLRPDAASRNWTPGETVADLLAENAAHGLSNDGDSPHEVA